MKPQQVRTLSQLIQAALDRRAVVCPSSPCFSKPIPAAFIQNLQAIIVHRLICRGLFVHTKKKGKKNATVELHHVH